jgi:hypothetical protein
MKYAYRLVMFLVLGGSSFAGCGADGQGADNNGSTADGNGGATAEDGGPPAARGDASAAGDDASAGETRLGHRASLYETVAPTERKNLNGTNSVLGVGLPRDVAAADLALETIEMPYPVFMYTRDADEIFVLGGTPFALETYVERIDGLPAGENATAPYFARYRPDTGEITYIDLDRGSGLPYVGGAVVHADGFIYVVSQAHLYKINPASMSIEASVDLPGGPTDVFNGVMTGRTGELILKSWSLGRGRTSLLLVDGATMQVTFSTDCDCATARLALAIDGSDVEHLYHLNLEQTFRFVVEPGSLSLDTDWISRFDPAGTGVNQEPTSPVILGGRVFYTTNTRFDSTMPMRVFWQDVDSVYTTDMPPLTGPLLFEDPEGRDGWSFSGLAADEGSGILVANDQGRGLVNAFRPRDDGGIDILWQRELLPSAASTIVSDRQMLYVTDFVDGSNDLVVLDLMTGDELLRVPTPATRATIGQILPTAAGDVYISSNETGRPTGFLVRIRLP